MAMILAKFRNFFKQWQKLLTDPQSYWRSAFSSNQYLLSFFVVSSLILGIASYLFFELKTVPALQTDEQATLLQIEKNYPANLKFAWDGEHLKNNLVTPLVVPYPSYVLPDQYGWPASLATILPSENSSASSQAAALNTATPSSLLNISSTTITINQGGQGSDVNLGDTPGFEQPFMVDHSSVPQQLAQIDSHFQSLLKTGEKLAVVGFPLGLTLNLLLISLLPSLLLWLFFRFYHWPYAFAVAWHLILLVTLVSELVQQIGTWIYPTTQVPLYGITFWVLLILVMFNAPRRLSIVTG